MPVPVTTDQFVELLKKSSLVETDRLDAYLQQLQGHLPSATDLAERMIDEGLLTNFQKEQLLQGKWRGYTIGKYRVLERLGTGGMGAVYLCEHQKMKHKVAVKVLPTAKAVDPAALGRFYREARAAGVLDHPNLVRAHDIDQDGELHYLVMDYIDGVNLQNLVVRSTGPLPLDRACHYLYQAAHGLQHAFEQGLIHRDIKPANLLLDRSGTVKILDMGLARFYSDNQDMLTLKYDDNNVLGTADYVSPEQAMDSHDVDIRTDIYSLGATFYFLLAGRTLFAEGKVAQKLIWHQTREPAPIREFRPEIPPELEMIVARMLAKEPAARFQSPAEVVAALEPFVQTPIAPPGDDEIPLLSPAARQGGGNEGGTGGRTPQRHIVGSSMQRHTAVRFPAPRAASLGSIALPLEDHHGSEHATPHVLVSGVSTDRLMPAPALVPARTVANPEPGVPPHRSNRRFVFLATLILGATAGVALRWVSRLPTSARQEDQQQAKAARILVVDRSKAAGTFASIRDALKEARPGDIIQVREAVWDEVLRLESGGEAGRDVIVQGGAGAPDKPVLWQAPTGRKDLSSLVHLSAVQRLRLRNFTLDGRDVTQNLVTVSGPCPGLILEDLALLGFRHAGVRLTSGAGDEKWPVLLHRLHAIPARDAEAAVLLDAYPDQPCRNVRLTQCKLEGRCQAGVLVAGSVVGLELTRCRLSGLADGVLVRKGNEELAVQLTLAGNEFRDISQAGLRFEAPPRVEGSTIRLTGNRFERVKTLAQTESFRTEPLRTPAAWIWGAENEKHRFHFRKEFTLETAPSRAILSLTADQECTIWLNGQRVNQVALGETPRHIASFDVARFLQKGDNVLAVEATRGTRAGLLAELNDNATGVFTRSFASDVTWKTSAHATTGWQSPTFVDRTWVPARAVTKYGHGEPAWCGLVWDALVQEQFKYQAGQVFPPPAGNERDATSAEGFPSFEAIVHKEG